MADGGDGFMGRCEVVEPRPRGKRWWPAEVKARIVAENLQPCVRVVDAAARYEMQTVHPGNMAETKTLHEYPGVRRSARASTRNDLLKPGMTGDNVSPMRASDAAVGFFLAA